MDPDTTVGFAVELFAREVLARPLDPWQRWLVIHGLELLPNGWPRFRQVVVLVARQNGKTELLVILSLFWLWVQRVGLVLGTSTKLDYSRESWAKAVKLARSAPELRPDIAWRGAVRNTNGEQEICTPWDSRYKIAAANEEGGRSLTVHRLVEDELRQHRDYSAHEAAENAMNAVDDAQAWAITNEGDERAVVLHDLYDAALHFIETGEGDYRLGLFAYSAKPGCDLLDLDETAQANPNLGRRILWESLVGKAHRAKQAGGEVEAKYRTEVMCQRVTSLDPQPIDPLSWALCEFLPSEPPKRPVFFLDSWDSLDGRVSSIGAAGMVNGRPHLELAHYASGVDWLPGRVAELKKRYPGAKFAVSNTGAVTDMLPALKPVDPIRFSVSDMGRACVHLKKLVDLQAVTHSGAAGLTQALQVAVKRDIGDELWTWSRRKSGDISPLVAVTGAAWLLETRPRYDLLQSVW